MHETSRHEASVLLTEHEIFNRMTDSLGRAIDLCQQIAAQPKSGPQFIALRAELKLIEGACRQAAVWREDTRWLEPARKCEVAHQLARGWLHRPTVASKRLFTILANVLIAWKRDFETLKTGKVGRRGIILPQSLDHSMPEAPSIAALPAHLAYGALPSGLLVPRA